MHRVDRSLLVPYSCAQMFALVRDVADYPQFLPWCASTEVRPQAQADVVEARVNISFLGVRSHFTTRNEQQEPDLIRLTLVDGPFHDLQGEWRFQPLGKDACKVSLLLTYRFGAGLLGRAIAPVFEKIANSLIDAFARRAQQLYGEAGDGQ
jgi:ribosome-associated toxin RatA of RatAB toxin-antitoxin module